MSLETEIKLRVASAGEGRELLLRHGFVEEHDRSFEANTVFDTERGELVASRRLLRVREFRGDVVVTFKGAPVEGPHKSRPEHEVKVSSGTEFELILGGLGFRRIFRYEKFRTSFADREGAGPESGHAVLDETPMGVFLELEGPGEWIDRKAAELGFPASEYITSSYGALWREHIERVGLAGGDMVFPG